MITEDAQALRHFLTNKLNLIQGYAELLHEREDLPADAQRCVTEIFDAAQAAFAELDHLP